MNELKARQSSPFTEPRQLSESIMDIGYDRVTVYFDDGFEGSVSVISGDEHLGTLPNVKEATRLAAYAISPEGGYKIIEMIPTDDVQPVTHETFDNWLS